jgi:hypothetical protein
VIINRGKIRAFFLEWWKDTYKTAFMMFKIMIPVSIVVKILQEAGAIPIIGNALSPLMELVGLPGEMGLVWATGMITNLFGGILAFMQISEHIPMSIAQVTIISAMMLVAHTFPIELQIARKSGVRIWVSFAIRFTGGFLLGALLHAYYSGFGLMQGTTSIAWKPDIPTDPSLLQWVIGELKNYGVILLFITSLLFLVKLLREIGVIRLITKALGPLLRLMGIGEGVTTITIIGLTLGIVYGGVLMIAETKSKEIQRRDIFYSLVLMGLCHSVIEDTILVLSLGADITGVLFIRLFFAIVVTWLMVRLGRSMSDKNFFRFIMTREAAGIR